jgi:hypothetical protein
VNDTCGRSKNADDARAVAGITEQRSGAVIERRQTTPTRDYTARDIERSASGPPRGGICQMADVRAPL